MNKKNKLKFLLISVLVMLSCSLFIVNGTVNRLMSFMGGTDYLIITPDEYNNNPKFLEFINFKRNQGFTVETKTMSSFSNPQNTVTNFLKITNLEAISYVGEYHRIYVLYKDITKYKIMGYLGLTGNFKLVNTPISPKEVCFFIDGDGAGTITLTYDNSQTTIVQIPDYPQGYLNWGENYITSDGQIYFNKTKADVIREYASSISTLKYMLILGNVKKVPSFSLREIIISLEDLETTVTDHPYSVKDVVSNKYLSPDIALGRLPVDTTSELEDVLTKAMRFKADTVGRSYFIKGNTMPSEQAIWDKGYNDYLRIPVNSSIYYLYNYYSNETIEPAHSDAVNIINSNNDNLIFFSHGSVDAIASGGIYASTIKNEISYIKPSLVFTCSCSTADFSYIQERECLAEAWITDSNSNCTTYIGSSDPTTTTIASLLGRTFFNAIYSEKTVGNSFKKAKIQTELYLTEYSIIKMRLEYHLFADPSLILLGEYVPPPVQYGWLELYSTVDSFSSTKNVTYTITFPNGTSKDFTAINLTLTQCLLGDYIIKCKHPDFGNVIQYTTTVKYNEGSKLYFSFSTQPYGTIRIRSNIPCYVRINHTDTLACPFDKINIPIGYYTFEALNDEYNSVLKTWSVQLEAGQDITYTFVLETHDQPIDYWSIIMFFAPFVLIGTAVVLYKV